MTSAPPSPLPDNDTIDGIQILHDDATTTYQRSGEGAAVVLGFNTVNKRHPTDVSMGVIRVLLGLLRL